jgi:Tol biopolymer transport system component
MRRLLLFVLAVLAAALAPAAQAFAAFTPPTLLSGSSTLQADYAYSPVISADGRYVVFTGSIASVTGVYRKSLEPGGEPELVAGGDANSPSISAEGRYVSFTTSDNPVTGASECSAVYVRDMDPEQPSATPDYELVSAPSGSTEPLTYGGSGEQNCPGGGSAAADRVALSGNGEKAVFTVIGQSNLTGPCTTTPATPTQPAKTTCPTPPDQVAVRNLKTDTTTLVSATLDSQKSETPEPVPGGATLAGTETASSENSHTKASTWIEESEGSPISASTAAISADGNAIAWMGIDIPAQSPVEPKYREDSPGEPDEYAEPLWRKIEGPPAPTRRVTGGDDPESPTGLGPLDLDWDPDGVAPEDTGPVYGTFIRPRGFSGSSHYRALLDDITPQLSANGETVAILSTAPAYGDEPKEGSFHPINGEFLPANAFIVNMHSGLTRSEALTRLTEWATTDFGGGNGAFNGAIEDIALSPDGEHLAFVTTRAVFPFAPPSLITPTVSEASYTQLYSVNLRAGTLALVSQGYDEKAANGDVYSPSLSENGEKLVFASQATNLVYGAYNPGQSDVFLTSEEIPSDQPGQQSITPQPPTAPPTPEWRISATIAHGSAGSLLLDVSVPGAGTLSARASAAVPVATSGHGSVARRSKTHRGARTSAGIHTKVLTRTVAEAHTTVGAPGLVQLRVLPTSPYRSLERERGGLYATIVLTFTAPNHRKLTESLQASFESNAATHGARAGARSKRSAAKTRSDADTPHKRGRP